MKIEKFNADNSRFGVVLSEEMKNHHVSDVYKRQVAHPHHILVVVAGFVPDLFVFQLGFDDLLVVVGDAFLFLFQS